VTYSLPVEFWSCIQFEPFRPISSDGFLWGPVGPLGARGPHRGHADPFEALRPLRGPMRLLHRDPYCTSGAQRAPLGPLLGHSGPCGIRSRWDVAYLTPRRILVPWAKFQPPRSLGSVVMLRQTNKHLNFELYINKTRGVPGDARDGLDSVPTGSIGALWAPWGPCGPLGGPLMTM
jgi:hypothetical protein